jgi:hypothetical protein
MLDGGELDWKIVVVDLESPLASQVHDVSELDEDDPVMKQLVEIREWFREYKLPQVVEFAFEGAFVSRDVALQVVGHQHHLWRRLVSSPRAEGEPLWYQHRKEWANGGVHEEQQATDEESGGIG